MQLLGISHSHFLHKSLAVRAFLPVEPVNLVSSHIDYSGRKHLCHFLYDFLDNLVITLLCHTPDFTAVSCIVHRCVFRKITENFRIACRNSCTVPWSFYFRNDLNVPFFGILYYVLDLLLGIEATVSLVPRSET